MLKAIVRERPRTPQALAAIKGIGKAKLERYGSALLQAVSGASSPGILGPVDEPPTATAPPHRVDFPEAPAGPEANPGEDPSSVSQEEWTCRLLDRGFSAREAAAIRGLEFEVIVRHADVRACQRRRVPIEAFLGKETISRWDSWLSEHGPRRPPADAAGLPELWRVFLSDRGAMEAASEPSDPGLS
jgi:ATP-dependent DNA helicase RecQ